MIADDDIELQSYLKIRKIGYTFRRDGAETLLSKVMLPNYPYQWWLRSVVNLKRRIPISPYVGCNVYIGDTGFVDTDGMVGRIDPYLNHFCAVVVFEL